MTPGEQQRKEAAHDKEALLEELATKLTLSIENGLARGTLKKGLDVASKDHKPPTREAVDAAMFADMRRGEK